MQQDNLFLKDPCPSRFAVCDLSDQLSTSNAQLYQKIRESLWTLDTSLSNKTFVVGDDLTIADLIAFQILEQRKVLK